MLSHHLSKCHQLLKINLLRRISAHVRWHRLLRLHRLRLICGWLSAHLLLLTRYRHLARRIRAEAGRRIALNRLRDRRLHRRNRCDRIRPNRTRSLRGKW